MIKYLLVDIADSIVDIAVDTVPTGWLCLDLSPNCRFDVQLAVAYLGDIGHSIHNTFYNIPAIVEHVDHHCLVDPGHHRADHWHHCKQQVGDLSMVDRLASYRIFYKNSSKCSATKKFTKFLLP